MRLLLFLTLTPLALTQTPNHAAARGHAKASLFHQTPTVSYYLTQIPTTTPNYLDYALVAIHTAPPSDTALLLPVERTTVTDRQGAQHPGVRYTQALLDDFANNVFPALVRKHPPLSRMIRAEILHYVDGQRFTDLPWFASTRTRRTPRIEYEQPAFTTSFERPSATAPWRPRYETYGMNGDADTEAFYTLAELRKARAATDKPLLEVVLTPAQLEAKQHADRQFALAVTRHQQSRRPGVVYKQGRFWKQFTAFDIPRAVFQGDGLPYAAITNLTDTDQIARTGRFQVAFVTYVDQFSERCTNPLPPGFTTLGAWKRDAPRGANPDYTINIDRRFKDKYIQYAEATRAQVGALLIDVMKEELKRPNPSLANAAMTTLSKGMEGIAAWNLFFEQVPCASATMRQLGENFHRASVGLPPLQQAGPPPTPALIAAAARESEAFTREDFEAGPDPSLALGQMTAALAQQKAGRGLPLAIEELFPFRHWRVTPDLPYKGPTYQPLIAIERAAPNIMRCAYGPAELTKSGTPLYKSFYFWYRQAPPELPALIAADATNKLPRTLHRALPACPATSLGLE
ncbi:MAG: hypothetical protein J0L64_28040 [Acidobacteria bacterium]|nr:hypothetical protein [Acidobacteriota bacterium]